MRYIKEIKEEERVVDHYYCKQRQTLKSRSGKSYLSLKLQDKTGILDAKVWDLNKEIQNFEEGDYIKIDGVSLLYQNEIQLKINKIRKSLEGEYVLDDYVRTTEKNVIDLITEFENYIDSIENNYIKKLLQNIFINNKKINELFKSHSAAKTMHHAYRGGLLEHTLSTVKIADFLSGFYENVNRDILFAIVMLHDIGKIFELSAFPTNDYTDDGQLLGHIVIGIELVTDECKKIDKFPHQLESLIKHGIISHHGEYEFGSPKRPKILEAYLAHIIDTMDSKVNVFTELVANNNTQSNWSGYNKMLGRNIRDSKFEE